MQFPGSMRLSTTTFLQVFREVCDSLVHYGVDRLIAVNGHGGNIAALTVARRTTRPPTSTRSRTSARGWARRRSPRCR
jgi:creatinine amidohydrolase